MKHVFFSGYQLEIDGLLDDWKSMKSVNFKSCSREDPGQLTIQGFHNNTGDDCTIGGLLVHCTASDRQSPWHNFVTDSTHWRDQDNGTPCEDEGGFLDLIPSDSFIDHILTNNSKKIWSTGNSEVTLTGTPGEPALI